MSLHVRLFWERPAVETFDGLIDQPSVIPQNIQSASAVLPRLFALAIALPPPQVIMLVVPVPLLFAWPFYTFMGSISCFSHFSRFLPQVSESPILRIISPWFVDETSATCYMLYIVVPWTEDDGGLVRSVSNSKNYSQWTASYNAEFQGSRVPFTQVYTKKVERFLEIICFHGGFGFHEQSSPSLWLVPSQRDDILFTTQTLNFSGVLYNAVTQ
jgi:hypothetical protein